MFTLIIPDFKSAIDENAFCERSILELIPHLSFTLTITNLLFIDALFV